MFDKMVSVTSLFISPLKVAQFLEENFSSIWFDIHILNGERDVLVKCLHSKSPFWRKRLFFTKIVKLHVEEPLSRRAITNFEEGFWMKINEIGKCNLLHNAGKLHSTKQDLWKTSFENDWRKIVPYIFWNHLGQMSVPLAHSAVYDFNL